MSMLNHPKPCGKCGDVFKPRGERKGFVRLFCSSACANTGRRIRRETRVCGICGSSFERKIGHYGNFCSKKCTSKHQSQTYGKLGVKFSLNGFDTTLKLAAAFLKKVDIKSPNHCWGWTAAKNKKGYGLYSIAGRTMGAHRYSYFLHFEDFDKRKLVCHKCDNPSCVNPNHLFLGTHKDNLVDASKKGRLKSKMCKNGLHEKTTENTATTKCGDRVVRTCVPCRKIAANKRYRKKIDVEENNKIRDTFCKNGHERNDQNTFFYEKRGRTIRDCRVCQRINAKKQQERQKQKNQAKDKYDYEHACGKGHVRTPENTIYKMSYGKRVRDCRVCHNIAARARHHRKKANASQ